MFLWFVILILLKVLGLKVLIKVEKIYIKVLKCLECIRLIFFSFILIVFIWGIFIINRKLNKIL